MHYVSMSNKEKREFWFKLVKSYQKVPRNYKTMTNIQVAEYIIEAGLVSEYKEISMGYTTSASINALAACTRNLPATCVQEFYDNTPQYPAGYEFTLPLPQECKPAKSRKNTMYRDEYDCPSAGQPTDQKQRDYLLAELNAIEYKARDKGERTFGLIDDPRPTTPADLVKRIQDGKFIIPKEFEEKKVYHPLEYIRWRDPAVKEDREGYEKFCETLQTESKQTERKIAIADPKDGLEILTAFESKYIN